MEMDSKLTKKAMFSLIIFVLTLLLTPINSYAVDKYWIGGSDWWDIPSNWSPTGQPQDVDSVYLIQSDATNREVWYQDTTYPSAVLGFLRIDATGTGTMTLSQSKDQREGI